jgi:hypothetical protein
MKIILTKFIQDANLKEVVQKFIILILITFTSCTSIPKIKSVKSQNKFLEELYFYDQYVRHFKNSYSDLEVRNQDSLNQKKLDWYFKKFGLPTSKLFTQNAYNGLYYTIQHANVEWQKKYLNYVKLLADSSLISNKKYAMTYDRILVGTIGKQKYGEQMFIDSTTNDLIYFPFVYKDSVQIYRNQLGLDYLDLNIQIRLIKK